MRSKRNDDILPEARLVGRSAKRAQKAPVPDGSMNGDRECDTVGDELASLIPMLILIGIIVLILWGAAR